jgi:DNA-binding LacI/PurR family transcriptional regulator
VRNKSTYEAIARNAKVSISTVARVARGNNRVNPELRGRVRRAAQKLGVELQSRKKKNKVLAFILSNRGMLHPFHSHILVGAQTTSAAHGYHMLFICYEYPASKSPGELDIPPILENAEEVSGLILAGTNSPNLLDRLSSRRVPFVVLGNNVLGDWEPERFDVVWWDDVQGAFEMTQHLQALGHREIYYVGNRRLTWYARRYEGYQKAMEEARLRARVSEFDVADDAQLGYLSAKSILNRNERVSAVFAGGDRAAQGVCKALSEKGLRVPDDVSIAGFNDIEAGMWNPPLTTVRVFPELISKRMVELLVNRISNPDGPPQHSMIPTELIKRESSDRCPQTLEQAIGDLSKDLETTAPA